MLKYSQLHKFDSSLIAVFGIPDSMDLESISSALKPEPNTFIFVKNMKFYQSVGRLSEDNDFSNTGIVLDENFFLSIKDTEIYSEMEKKFSWGATVQNIAKAMCLLSKPFYDLKYENLNYYVDGRQMGNAEVDPTAQIAQNVFVGSHAQIGKDVRVMAGATILPNVVIDEGTIIFPNVTIYPYSNIGKNCRIHASAVIGGDGFGYNFFDGAQQKIWHLGGVIIEDNVEIGGAAMVDAGAFIATKVGEGTKLDNSCQISHNAQIGKHCVFAGGAGSSGSGEVGDYCAFGARAGLAPGARVGNKVMLGAYAIVSENAIIPDNSVLAGHPARPLKEWLKSKAELRKLIKK